MTDSLPAAAEEVVPGKISWGEADRSEAIEKLAAALAAAQAEIAPAVLNADNPHRQSRYADLASVWEACRKALTSHGLAVVQRPRYRAQQLALRTELLHDSGQWIGATYPILLPKGNECDPQKVGSAITYARRYSLAAMVGVAPGGDDDAEAARHPASSPSTRQAGPTAARGAATSVETWREFNEKTVYQTNMDWHNVLAIEGIARERRDDLLNPWQLTNAIVTRALNAGLLRDHQVEDEHSPGKRDKGKAWHAMAKLFREQPGRVRKSVEKYLDDKRAEERARLGLPDPDAEDAAQEAAGAAPAAETDTQTELDHGDAWEGPEPV